MNVLVRVDARLRVDVRELSEDCIADLKAEFVHKNPQHAKLKSLKLPTWKEPPVIRTWTGGPGTLNLPRGGTASLREVLKKHGHGITWKDERTSPHVVPSLLPPHNVELRPYQAPCVDAAIVMENCIVRSPTGSGKTTVAMALAQKLGVPVLVIVMSGELLDQWVQRAQTELGLSARDIGVIRAGKLKLKPLTIAMQQTLAKLDDDDQKAIGSYFGAVICDEVHKFAARTFTEVIDWMPARYRIGMSADETRKDRKEFLIYDLFGAVAAEIKKEDLIAASFVVDVEVRAMESGAQASWYRAEHDNKLFMRLLDQLANDDARNGKIADLAAREVALGHQVLIFSHRRDHCARLASHLAIRKVKSKCMLGGAEDSAELKEALAGLRDGSLRAAVGTIQAIGTGIDIPTINRGILATPIVSNRQLFGQVTGRLCRSSKGKSEAVLYVMHDSEAFGDYPLRNFQKWATMCTWEDELGGIITLDEHLADGAPDSDDGPIFDELEKMLA